MGDVDRTKAASDKQRKDDKLASAVGHLSGSMERKPSTGVGVVGFKVRGPQYEHGDYLCVLQAVTDAGEAVVAFHNATSLEDALSGAGHRLRAGKLKWYEDQYNQPQ